MKTTSKSKPHTVFKAIPVAGVFALVDEQSYFLMKTDPNTAFNPNAVSLETGLQYTFVGDEECIEINGSFVEE